MTDMRPQNGQIPPYGVVVLILAFGISTLDPEQVAHLGASIGLAEVIARLIKVGGADSWPANRP
ncbi:hypothetical protein [Streptomyces hebeiensis]